MQITDAASTRLAQTADPVAARSPAALRPGAAYDTNVEPGNRLAIGRQALLRVLASEVIQSLGGALGGVSRNGTGYGPQDASGLGAAAQALRAALQGGSNGSSDPVPELLAKVEAALGEARDTLQALGAHPAEVAQATADFRNRVGGLVDAAASAPAEEGVSLTAVSARHVRKERGSIELVTQDGDVVRIRFRSKEAERVGYAEIQAGGVSASSTRVDAYSGTRIKVDVNGSLDEGELEAIRGFLGEVDALADRFFAGDVEQAFAQGAALKFDADEIARFSLKLSLSERVQVDGVRRVLTPLPAASSGAQVPNTLPATGATPATDPQAAASPPTSPAAAPSAPAANGASIGDTIREFLDRVFDAAQAPLTVRRYDVSWSVKIRIVAEAIEAARPEAKEAGGGSALLQRTLERAADQSALAAS